MRQAGWCFPAVKALGLLCLLLSCSNLADATSTPESETGIVRVGGRTTLGLNGGGVGFQANFLDKNCRPFVLSGWNSWEVVEAAFGVASVLPPNLQTPEAGKELLNWVFDQGQAAGLNVIRFLGHGWSSKMVLQPEPGVYSEEVLLALDWVVHNAYQRGLKIVLTFTDNNNEYDSRISYAKSQGKLPMEFFTDAVIKCLFKNQLKFIVNRRNKYSGFLYKEDPTIFGWNLINEPRCDCDITVGGKYCEMSCPKIVSQWVWEMADYLKSVDPQHMVVVGEEGFYSQTIHKIWANPDAFIDNGPPWAQHAGHDFVWDHSSPAIDYLGVHLNTDKWCMPKKWYQALFIREHKEDAWNLHKPLVIEEFGKLVFNFEQRATCSERDQYFEQVYDIFASDVRNNGPLQGVCLNQFDAGGGVVQDRGPFPPQNVADDMPKPPPGPYGIRPEHGVWKNVIKPVSWTAMSVVEAKPLATYCVPGEQRSMDAIFYTEFISGGQVVVDSDIYYATHGTHLDALYLGTLLGSLDGCSTYLTCMQRCESIKGCITFRFNSVIGGGTCKFYTKASESYGWNSDGWQVFYKRKAFANCLDEGCKFCNHLETCLRCEVGNLYWNKQLGRPVCPQRSIEEPSKETEEESAPAVEKPSKETKKESAPGIQRPPRPTFKTT